MAQRKNELSIQFLLFWDLHNWDFQKMNPVSAHTRFVLSKSHGKKAPFKERLFCTLGVIVSYASLPCSQIRGVAHVRNLQVRL